MILALCYVTAIVLFVLLTVMMMNEIFDVPWLRILLCIVAIAIECTLIYIVLILAIPFAPADNDTTVSVQYAAYILFIPTANGVMMLSAIMIIHAIEDLQKRNW